MAKTIMVTGASGGLGKAVALRFAEEGWGVAATMRDTAKGSAFSDKGSVAVIELDITKRETMQPAVDETVERFGSIDVLFNNVGYGGLQIFEEVSDESFSDAFETNFFGHLALLRCVLPVMRRQGSGHVINVTSLAGLFGIPLQTAYCSSKFAMTGFSEAVKWELRGQGIETTVFEVGGIATGFSDHMHNDRENPISDYDEYMGRMMTALEQATQKFKRLATPADRVAEKVLRLANKRRKPFRYHPTRDAKVMASLKRLLPDRAFRKMSSFGLD